MGYTIKTKNGSNQTEYKRNNGKKGGGSRRVKTKRTGRTGRAIKGMNSNE